MALSLDLATIAIDILARPAVLYRWSDPAWLDNGTYDPDANEPWLIGATPTSIDAVVQPPTTRDLQMLDLEQASEGERVEGLVVIWTRTGIKTADEAAGTAADEVEQNGRRYKIVTVMERTEAGFTRALGRLIGGRERSV